MSDIYVFSPNEEENDYASMGLVGALTPTECTFTEDANGESLIEMTHPLDEFGRYTHLVRGNILVVPVPVRTTPEIQGGKCVTQVWRYKVKPKKQLTSTAQRTLYKKEKGTGRKKVMKPGDRVTVVLRREKEDENTRWKVKSKYGTGWINPDGFEEDKEELIPDNSQAIEEIQSPWTVTDQLFRIYEVEKSIDSIDVSARHISYDLLYNLTYYRNKESATLQEALDGILTKTYAPHDFTAYTNVDNSYTGLFYDNKNPIEAMLDPEEGLCTRYDVCLVRDNYDLYFLHDPGVNRGVRIQYSKNMTGVEFTESDEEVVTRVVPTGEKKNGSKLYLTDNDDSIEGRYIDSPLYTEHPELFPVIHVNHYECENCKVAEEEEANGDDKSDGKVTKKIARERMKAQVQKLFEAEVDRPKIEMSVEFLNLGDTEEYKQFKNLENCFLFDYVIVQHPRLNIDVTSRIVQIQWDCLTDRMTGVEIGSLQETLANQGITSWQIPDGVSGSKIAEGTLGAGQLGDDIINVRHVQAGSINAQAIQAEAVTTEKLQAGAITTEKLEAECVTAEKIAAGVIEGKSLNALQGYIKDLTAGDLLVEGTLAADLAKFNVLVAGSATFDRETVKHLIAEAMNLEFGEAGTVHISNLLVTYAQMVAATIGDLIIKASDGKYYHLDVDSETGTVTATEEPDVTESDIEAGHKDGRTILDTEILAKDLSTTNLFATYALINKIDAARIDVDQLFAREAVIDALKATSIYGDFSLEFLAKATVGEMKEFSAAVEEARRVYKEAIDQGKGMEEAIDLATEAYDATYEELRKANEAVTKSERATYMRIVSPHPDGVEVPPEDLDFKPGVYIGLRDADNKYAANEAFIDAEGWFRVLQNGESITALGPRRQELGTLVIFEDSEGGHAFL